MKKSEASYTVELALLLPVILFSIFAPVYLGFELYKQTMAASVCCWEDGIRAEERVLNIKFAKEVLEE